jgi:cytochrome c
LSAAITQESLLRSVWDGVFSEAQAQRGKVSYQARCAVCHGQDLLGDIESPSLTGLRFNSDWVGKTIAERFQRIRKTMPPEQPGSLDNQVSLDLVAFILKFNGYPSGKQELETDVRVLEKIVIERPR